MKDNKQRIDNGIPFDSSIQMTDKNFSKALGNVDLLGIKRLKNGDIELLTSDTYDFNLGEKSDLVQIGREKQEKGEIIPYFMLYHVVIPKDSIKVKNR